MGREFDAARVLLASQPQEMGTFDGIAIWRNKMCAAETFADGYVCMCNLTPPDCHELLASTFVGEPIGTDKHQATGWFVICIYCRLLKISKREQGYSAI